MIKKIDRNKARAARHTRVRNKVTGTSNVPRLNVFRSNNNIFAQIIDDEASKTLVSASSIDKELKLENGGNIEAAKAVGKLLAEKLGLEVEYIDTVIDEGSQISLEGKITLNNVFVGNLYEDCKRLAKAIQNNLIAETGTKDRGVQENDKVTAINYSKVPMAVLQLGFMSNVEEDTNLWSESYQDKMIKAICDGIDVELLSIASYIEPLTVVRFSILPPSILSVPPFTIV